MVKLSIIIPVYNERELVLKSLKKVEQAPLPKGVTKEIIIIDDGSTDGTRDILKRIRKHKVIFHKQNKGKGGAVKTGFKAATGDIFIIQDADLEYDPRDYVACITPILNGQAEVVYGSRTLGKRKIKYSGITFWIGGTLVTIVTDLLFFATLTDEPTCYKVFTKRMIRSMKINADNFDWEPEITAKILKRGHKIIEVPIRYYPRDVAHGKKIKWKDGISALWTLLKYRFVG
jgi:dolichol-phosphate mannosyltransferase